MTDPGGGPPPASAGGGAGGADPRNAVARSFCVTGRQAGRKVYYAGLGPLLTEIRGEALRVQLRHAAVCLVAVLEMRAPGWKWQIEEM